MVGELQSSISDVLDNEDMTRVIVAKLAFESSVFNILPAPRASTAADRYSGRFKARYYIRNAEALFAKKKNIGIARACDELDIPLDIWVLEGVANIKSFDEHGPQVYARIAGI